MEAYADEKGSAGRLRIGGWWVGVGGLAEPIKLTRAGIGSDAGRKDKSGGWQPTQSCLFSTFLFTFHIVTIEQF